ncbi:GRF1-interacting factor 2-like isoform X2 [Salvia hispanica]|uniref:GRF1-interacting factor 2-like isoform X2 n=1 Tax=Salvia hispanica TaxID=49212 RepID=UPI0020093046|nr:GRF1-interacting factor 2-like isoform X2 [Salvia hispanica]
MSKMPPNTPPSMPLNLVSTEQIQKYLDENKNLIMAILEFQKVGKVAECAQYQAVLQKNLMYLAAIADAQPPGSSTPSQMATSSMAPRGDSHMQQSQASTVHHQQQQQQQQQQHQQQQQQQPKLPFQLNALRPQDQHNQMLQFQQQQLQMQQGHFNLAGGANNGLHMLMHPSHGNANMMDLRGNHSGTLEASSGNAQGNSGLGRDGRE